MLRLGIIYYPHKTTGFTLLYKPLNQIAGWARRVSEKKTACVNFIQKTRSFLKLFCKQRTCKLLWPMAGHGHGMPPLIPREMKRRAKLWHKEAILQREWAKSPWNFEPFLSQLPIIVSSDLRSCSTSCFPNLEFSMRFVYILRYKYPIWPNVYDDFPDTNRLFLESSRCPFTDSFSSCRHIIAVLLERLKTR